MPRWRAIFFNFPKNSKFVESWSNYVWIWPNLVNFFWKFVKFGPIQSEFREILSEISSNSVKNIKKRLFSVKFIKQFQKNGFFSEKNSQKYQKPGFFRKIHSKIYKNQAFFRKFYSKISKTGLFSAKFTKNVKKTGFFSENLLKNIKN